MSSAHVSSHANRETRQLVFHSQRNAQWIPWDPLTVMMMACVGRGGGSQCAALAPSDNATPTTVPLSSREAQNPCLKILQLDSIEDSDDGV
jgi:hypothetical protein